jgi:predicted permease
MSDLRLALRLLRRTPFVSGVAIISLALGIGANAAVFSLIDQMLLRPMPVQSPDELVLVTAPGPVPGSQSCSSMGGCDEVWTYPMYRDLEREQTGFLGIGGHRDISLNLSANGWTLSTEGMLVSANYFALLGLVPTHGRFFTPEEAAQPGDGRVVVLSHDFWQTAFGSDPAIVGRTIIVNGQSLEVIGIGPKGFRGTSLNASPRLFVPLTMRAALVPGFDGFENRQSYWLYLFGRLKPGVTAEQAAAQLTVPLRRILDEVEAPALQGISDRTMREFRTKQVRLPPGGYGASNLRDDLETPLYLLFAVTAVVLLIACANISNLLLARGASRTAEMAVRLAIGGTRRQLLGQLLSESLVLGLFGGLAGLGIAQLVLRGVAALLPTFASGTFRPTLDLRVLAFTAAITLTTVLVVGLFPAFHSTRPDLIGAIREQGGQPSGGKSASWWRTMLATSQVALATALLASAALFAQSLRNVMQVNLGFSTSNLITFTIAPELNGYEPARSQQLFQRLTEALEALPGVRSVSGAMVPMLAGSSWGSDVAIEGRPVDPDADNNARLNAVGAGFIGTMGMTLLAGREFTTSDVAGAPRIAIVNETFVKHFELGSNVIGRRMNNQGFRADSFPIEIVGVVKDVRHSRVKSEMAPIFFVPYPQRTTLGRLSFYVRTDVAPEGLVTAVGNVVKELDPNLPVQDLLTMTEQVEQNIYLDRFMAIFATTFALLATLLAAIGLYGVLAYTVTQRTREFGVRMALGADPGRVLALVMRDVGLMTLIGVAIGLGVAVALGRLAASQLYGMEGPNLGILALAAAGLALVALSAGLVPALRASRLQPVRALRFE